ncbi:hypothetical protein SAMN05880561_102875 [Rhizobium sp. RU33A]|uniref:DUF6220 domain-containing protein n=1 Tax=Rhizobium sp. RU33A TaxID=1907413 RepID=UPI000953AFB1|nr:DUF6220 domain-containing protein [Rhizobium sp. RU33A]SIQ35202.1 hypothetical protein SAMN05880561_102875 [Rhizobium sp. RU33A]
MSAAVSSMPFPVLVFRGLAIVVLGGVAGQFFLAGMTVFGAGAGWDLHAATGGALGLPVLALFLLSLSQALRGYRRSGALLFAVYLLQVALAGVGDALPMLGALHPVNGMLMGLITVRLVGRTAP